MRQFHRKLDADKNGVLDKEEFTKWMTTQFSLPGAPLARQARFIIYFPCTIGEDVDKVMEMWDIDNGGTIGPYVTLLMHIAIELRFCSNVGIHYFDGCVAQ